MDAVKSTDNLETIARALTGRTISSVDVPAPEAGEEGAWLVLELGGGLRLYLDAPTLYGDPNAPRESGRGDYGPPPEGLEDAWRRFQAGEHVDPHEARKLDEWRADVEREAFGS